MNILCRIFGHSASMVDSLMFNIYDNAINRQAFLNEELLCERCGEVMMKLYEKP